MDWNALQGQWIELKGRIREEFGALTDDDITRIAGEREQLIGKLQQRYGYTETEATRRIEQVMKVTPS